MTEITVDAEKLLLVLLAQGRHRHDRQPEHGTPSWLRMRRRQLERQKANCPYCKAREQLLEQCSEHFGRQP